MPKILRIINRFNLGGPTLNVAYLSKYMCPEFETMLVGGSKDDSEESSEFILEELGIRPIIIPEMQRKINLKNDWIAYYKIKKLIEAYKPDIVHTHAAKAGTIGRLAAFNTRVPVIVHTFHGHVFHSYFGKVQTTVFKNIERYLAKRSSAIVAISERQKEEIAAIHRVVSRDKISVIPLGFDLSKFSDKQEEKRAIFRDKYSVKEDEIAIGIIGRLVPVKNHNLFLNTLKKVKENTSKRIRAFIIGDGETLPGIIKHAKELKLDYSMNEHPAMLMFTSWIREIDMPCAGLDIIALTSFNEGTPVSLIEAQAAGKPVVSTRVGGIENIVKHNETGLLSEINDVDGFYHNLMELITNEEKRKQLGKAGCGNIREKFHYSRLVSDMKQLYGKLLNPAFSRVFP